MGFSAGDPGRDGTGFEELWRGLGASLANRGTAVAGGDGKKFSSCLLS